jgi:hypothetical protein
MKRNLRRLGVLPLLLMLVGIGCEGPLSPVMPEWDVDLNIPVMVETYTMEDLLESDSLVTFSRGEGDMLIVQRRYPIDRVELGDALRLDDQFHLFTQQVGSFRFDVADVIDREVTVGEVFPALATGTGVVAPFVSQTESVVPLDASASFTRVVFQEGEARLLIENSLPVPVSFAQPVALYDAQRRLLATIPIASSVPAHGSLALPPISLDGMELQSMLQLGIVAATQGSGGAQVTVRASDGLRVRGSFTATRVVEAVAALPAQTIEWQDRADVSTGNGSRITRGTARSGSIRLSLTNHLPVGASIEVAVPSVLLGGAPLTRTLTVGARGSAQTTIAVAGAVFTPADERSLVYTVRVLSEATAPRHVALRATDSIALVAELNDVLMDRMDGVLSPQVLLVNQQTIVDLALSQQLQGDLAFSTVRMWAEVMNATPFPAELTDGVVIGRTVRNAVIDSLSFPSQSIAARTRTRIDLDEVRVTKFFNSLDTKASNTLDLRGSLLLNRQGQYGSATARDSISGDLFIEFPMKVAVQQGTLEDTTALLLDSGMRDRLAKVHEGLFTFVLENRLPAGVEIEPQILDAEGKVLFTPTTVEGTPMKVESAPLDARGHASAVTTTRMQLRLNGDEFRKLSESTQARIRLRMQTPGAATAVFRTTDYVKVRAFATITTSSAAIIK